MHTDTRGRLILATMRPSINARPSATSTPARALLILLSATACGARGVLLAKTRRNYEADTTERLQKGHAEDFSFGRFQRSAAVKRAFERVRSADSFKFHKGKDGRKGFVCSTKLGGDWVLAESEQLAPSCTCEQVVIAYLDSRLQKRWSADKVIDVKTTRQRPKDGEPCYQQALVLHSQRVIRSSTGVMRYSQRIVVDKIGRGNYAVLVTLDPDVPSTPKKPFNTLCVYVGLEQEGPDVRIYASGVFEVNRRVVPNLVVFDASGIAGDMAGKGTLWLNGHFEELKAKAHRGRSSPPGARLAERLRSRLRDVLPPSELGSK